MISKPQPLSDAAPTAMEGWKSFLTVKRDIFKSADLLKIETKKGCDDFGEYVEALFALKSLRFVIWSYRPYSDSFNVAAPTNPLSRIDILFKLKYVLKLRSDEYIFTDSQAYEITGRLEDWQIVSSDTDALFRRFGLESDAAQSLRLYLFHCRAAERRSTPRVRQKLHSRTARRWPSHSLSQKNQLIPIMGLDMGTTIDELAKICPAISGAKLRSPLGNRATCAKVAVFLINEMGIGGKDTVHRLYALGKILERPRGRPSNESSHHDSDQQHSKLEDRADSDLFHRKWPL